MNMNYDWPYFPHMKCVFLIKDTGGVLGIKTVFLILSEAVRGRFPRLFFWGGNETFCRFTLIFWKYHFILSVRFWKNIYRLAVSPRHACGWKRVNFLTLDHRGNVSHSEHLISVPHFGRVFHENVRNEEHFLYGDSPLKIKNLKSGFLHAREDQKIGPEPKCHVPRFSNGKGGVLFMK